MMNGTTTLKTKDKKDKKQKIKKIKRFKKRVVTKLFESFSKFFLIIKQTL